MIKSVLHATDLLIEMQFSLLS